MPKMFQKLRHWFGRSARRPIPVNQPAAETSDEPLAGVPPGTDGLTVIPALNGRLTRERAVSKALVSLSRITSQVNKHSAKTVPTESLTQAMANAIIDIANTMATVPDTDKPRMICAYHVFATQTAIANFLVARDALRRLPKISAMDGGTGHAIICIAITLTFFGMAVLATPESRATRVAAAIAAAVAESMSYTEKISDEAAYEIAVDIISRGESADSGSPPPPPYRAPLVSILTSEEMSGLARSLAVAAYRRGDDMSAIHDAVWALHQDLFAFTCDTWGGRSCRSKGKPVCFCRTRLLSADKCKLYLLPRI
ncbi:hypothetical protein QBC42DRAFT_315456 [Cladorrhinum samala]|uniref:Uncharacterized protein n=1 Tax=Cladorrhinum samala TaxID=585594 RepID=A0AAV9I1E5_9PEZI|nr:hypothetical protein QBC42DRAFT_315456 [Cladorrhinum samala]